MRVPRPIRFFGTTTPARAILCCLLLCSSVIAPLPSLADDLDSRFPVKGYAQGGVVVDGIAYFTANSFRKDPASGDKTFKPKAFPYVVAFDLRKFRVMRTYRFEDTYDSSPLVIRNRVGRWLVVAHEYRNGRTVAMNRDTGKVEWRSPANQPGAYFFGYSYFCQDNGGKLILTASQNGLHALAAEDGTERWHFPAKSRGGVTPCVDQSRGLVYYQYDGGLVKLDARTGRVLKQTRVPAPLSCISWNTVLADDKHGYHVATYWYDYGNPRWNSAIRVYDQELDLIWEKKNLPMSKKATLTYAGGKIFAGSGNGWAPHTGDKWKAVTAYRIKDGSVAWRCNLARYEFVQIMNVPYFNGYVFAETGNTLASKSSKILKINASTGAVEGEYDYGENVTSCATSIIAHGLLLSGALHVDRIAATRIAAGSKLDWPGPFGDPQTNQMALAEEPGAQLVEMRPAARAAGGNR